MVAASHETLGFFREKIASQETVFFPTNFLLGVQNKSRSWEALLGSQTIRKWIILGFPQSK